MPPEPSPPLAVKLAESLPSADVRTRRRGTGARRRGPRWRRRLAIAAGLIAAGVLAAFAWSEYYPRALAEADAAYRRNDLETTLLGQSYYLEGASDDAERCWRLAIFWDPERFGAWSRLGKLELQRGWPKEERFLQLGCGGIAAPSMTQRRQALYLGPTLLRP
jgi:hypothetical protein